MSNVTYSAGNLTITVAGLDTVEQALGDLKRKTPAAAKVAINATARQARKLMVAKAKTRYAVNAVGRRHLKDLVQRKKASNSSLMAELHIAKMRNDLGYFKTSPAVPTHFTGMDFKDGPSVWKAKVLKSSGMKTLPGAGGMSKGFLVKFSSGHVGMVQRRIGSKSSHTRTAKGYKRWTNAKGNVEKLVTMGSPSATAMHHTIWPEVEPSVEEYLQERLQAQVERVKLLAILERRVKDPAMMAFIRGVVNSRAEPFGLPRWRTPQDTLPEEWLYEVGMPIGNLTSQLFANIYLNELDQYCKHRLKIHYYIRYMDDVIILGKDKETLHRWKAAVETFLREELALDLNSKTSIRPVRQGVEFVGVRIWPTHMKLRKSTVRRIKREVRKISALYAAGDMTRQDFYRRIASIRGLLKHTESASLRWRLNEIYRAELEKAKQKQLREEAQHEPFADHSGAGNGDGNAGTGYQDHGNPACRAG